MLTRSEGLDVVHGDNAVAQRELSELGATAEVDAMIPGDLVTQPSELVVDLLRRRRQAGRAQLLSDLRRCQQSAWPTVRIEARETQRDECLHPRVGEIAPTFEETVSRRCGTRTTRARGRSDAHDVDGKLKCATGNNDATVADESQFFSRLEQPHCSRAVKLDGGMSREIFDHRTSAEESHSHGGP